LAPENQFSQPSLVNTGGLINGEPVKALKDVNWLIQEDEKEVPLLIYATFRISILLSKIAKSSFYTSSAFFSLCWLLKACLDYWPLSMLSFLIRKLTRNPTAAIQVVTYQTVRKESA
jgi:hypothetical protein